MKFNFATANRIIFGNGSLEKIAEIITSLGKNVLIIKGKDKPDPSRLFELCEAARLTNHIFIVEAEPDIDMINSAVKIGRENKCDVVIGFGGGSVIDTGKAVAALLTNDELFWTI